MEEEIDLGGGRRENGRMERRKRVTGGNRKRGIKRMNGGKREKRIDK